MIQRHRLLIATLTLATGLAGLGLAQGQQVPTRKLPLVWVLATGGTIAGRGASSTSVSEYKPGVVLGEDLVESVPEIKQYAEVKVEQLFNVSSSDLTLDNWLTLA